MTPCLRLPASFSGEVLLLDTAFSSLAGELFLERGDDDPSASSFVLLSFAFVAVAPSVVSESEPLQVVSTFFFLRCRLGVVNVFSSETAGNDTSSSFFWPFLAFVASDLAPSVVSESELLEVTSTIFFLRLVLGATTSRSCNRKVCKRPK